MPFLRAALIPHQPQEAKKSQNNPKPVINGNLMIALHAWMIEDDRQSQEELTRLGLA